MIDETTASVGNCPGAVAPPQSIALGSAGGGALAVWLSNCSIWAARYSPTTGWTTPEVIGQSPVDSAPNWIWAPVLAVNDVGGAIAVWATQAGVSPPYLVARRWDALSGWAAPAAVSGPDGGLSVDHDPVASAAMDRAGNALVVWASAGVRAARFTAGAGWSAPARLTGSPVGDPRVAFEASGRALASWGESGVPTVRWFDPVLGWTAPIQFPGGSVGGWQAYSGAVTAFGGAGRALLLWERAVVSGLTTTYDVWGTLFDGSGWRELGPVSSSGVSSGGPGLGTDSQGRGLSVWAEPDRLVFARLDFATGLEPPRTAVAVAQAGPHLAVAASGHAVLAWQRLDPSQGRDRNEASYWDGSTWAPIHALQGTSQAVGYPSAVIDSCGNALVVWHEGLGWGHIWAERFDAGC
jgi:hypothetical protein